MVSRAHGIRAARAGCAFDPGRRPIPDHAVGAQSQGEVSRVIPAVRSFGPARSCQRLVELDYDSPYMLLVADVVKGRRKETTSEERALFGIDKLNVPRSEIPAVTHIDYSARIQTVHAERTHATMRLSRRSND